MQAQLDLMAKEMEKAKKVQKSSPGTSSTTATPSAKHPGPSPASAKPRASSKVAPPDAPGSDSDNEELTQGAKLGRLSRLCERKPSGKLHVPLEVHEKWLQKGRARDELLEQLEASDWNPDRVW